MSLDTILETRLLEKRQQQLYRERSVGEDSAGVYFIRGGKRYLNFCSNDYLGLANHPEVKKAFIQSAEKYGVGSGASHLVTGHSREHHALEEELADFLGRPRSLLFSTGYMANMGVINALAGKGDVVIEDKLNHASLIDAAQLSRAELRRFKHNDMEDAERLLKKSEARHRLVAVDGVFSMDGDIATLDRLVPLCEKYGASLMVDDAHALGCLGNTGRGTADLFSLSAADVPIYMATLGKALGTFGAFVAGSEALIESLIQFSRTYIYTTALPPAIAAATRASLRIVRTESGRRQTLAARVSQFREGCAQMNLPLLPSSSPIQGIILGESQAALAAANSLREQGIWISAIRPPTVPNGSARLRITLSAEHTEAQLEKLLNALVRVLARRDIA